MDSHGLIPTTRTAEQAITTSIQHRKALVSIREGVVHLFRKDFSLHLQCKAKPIITSLKEQKTPNQEQEGKIRYNKVLFFQVREILLQISVSGEDLNSGKLKTGDRKIFQLQGHGFKVIQIKDKTAKITWLCFNKHICKYHSIEKTQMRERVHTNCFSVVSSQISIHHKILFKCKRAHRVI